MMTPVNADDNMENMKTGQGSRGVWPGELPEEMTSEQRPEGIREGPMGGQGGIWGLHVSGRGHRLCKVTRVGVDLAWAGTARKLSRMKRRGRR